MCSWQVLRLFDIACRLGLERRACRFCLSSWSQRVFWVRLVSLKFFYLCHRGRRMSAVCKRHVCRPLGQPRHAFRESVGPGLVCWTCRISRRKFKRFNFVAGNSSGPPCWIRTRGSEIRGFGDSCRFCVVPFRQAFTGQVVVIPMFQASHVGRRIAC